MGRHGCELLLAPESSNSDTNTTKSHSRERSKGAQLFHYEVAGRLPGSQGAPFPRLLLVNLKLIHEGLCSNQIGYRALNI